MSNTQSHFGRSSGLGSQRMVIAAHTAFMDLIFSDQTPIPASSRLVSRREMTT
jgi:hypothetical protein